jgi:hypothetical protein
MTLRVTLPFRKKDAHLESSSGPMNYSSPYIRIGKIFTELLV